MCPACKDAGAEDQMTVKDLEVLFDYGYWANRKLFQVVSQLTPEQFTEPVDGTFYYAEYPRGIN
jgi:hypothetical protein